MSFACIVDLERLHAKMRMLARLTTCSVRKSTVECLLSGRIAYNQRYFLAFDSACRFAGGPTLGGISPVSDSRKATKSVRCCPVKNSSA